jgi:hypothetical protein
MRQTLLNRLRTGTTAIVITVQIIFYPLAVFAQEAPTDVPSDESEQSQAAEETPATPVSPADTGPTDPVGPQDSTGPTEPVGPQQPTGSDSTTYVQNPDTGMWENDHYVWDPATGQTKPKDAPNYSYNPDTGMWDTTEWYYSPEAGKYLPNVISSAQNPLAAADANNLISNTGANSNNQIQNNGTNNGNFNLFFNAAISNKIGQISRSGNASVQGNTLGGNALTGDAEALATLLNMIQSSWGGLGSDEDMALFIANIDGNLTGDLLVDPNALANQSGNTNINVNATSNAAIDNDIDVTVASGSANVSGNTKAGDATSGKAHAVVNLLNLINSAIKSKKSFVGVLNINGNLDGDILLPPEMLKSIIAATGPNSNNQIQDGSNVNANVNTTKNTTINNNIHTDVGTGTATVANNTTAGSATSGKADSNVVLLNLTGKKVVAKNAMLVFVNVMGSWVGLIFDAPAGTNAVAVTGPGSNNTIDDDSTLNVDVDSTSNNLINNDVNVSAHSGDATVVNNTTGGNAKTGDASVGVNVLNMVDSEFSIDDWFGVLFINVFGSWVGSFGVNTSAGNQPTAAGVVPTATSSPAANSQQTAQTFSFVPHDNGTGAATQGVVAGATNEATPPPATQASSATPALTSHSGATTPSQTSNLIWIAGIVTMSGVLLLGGERLVLYARFRQWA